MFAPLNSLTNNGSANANTFGLYYHTVRTNQATPIIEGNSTVDIGFHYIAVNANGLAVDSDLDGIPDYLEDLNGDGVLDSGETDPNDGGDWGLRVFITRPRNGSAIP